MSNNSVSLNGKWNFKFYDVDFEEGYIEKEWDKIPVPYCWELFGYENPNYSELLSKSSFCTRFSSRSLLMATEVRWFS